MVSWTIASVTLQSKVTHIQIPAISLSKLPSHVMALARTPLRLQPLVTITVGGDTNKKRALEGSIAPPPSTDTQMDDIATD